MNAERKPEQPGAKLVATAATVALAAALATTGGAQRSPDSKTIQPAVATQPADSRLNKKERLN